MACNDKFSTLDTSQAIKRVIDAEHDAIRITQAINTEMYIQISAEDADSVESVARSRTVTPEDGVVDCSRMRKLCKFGSANGVEISADGQSWEEIPAPLAEVMNLCAMKIRVLVGTLVIQS